MTLAPGASRNTSPADTSSRRWRTTVERFWVPVALALIAVVGLGTITVSHSPAMSPLDEWVYYDYVLKIPSQGIVHGGEHIGHQALVTMACYGDSFGARGEPCDHVTDDFGKYPLGAKTSADAYTPIYFAITWALGSAIHFVTGADFLTAARSTGIIWLVGGLLVFYRLLRRLRVSNVVAFGLGLVVIASPMSVWANTYISTDAPSFLLGAAVTWMGVAAVQRVLSPWWLVPLSTIAVLIKVTNILAVGLVLLLVLGYALFARRDEASRTGGARLVIATSTAALVAIVAEVLWLMIRASIAIGPGPDSGISKPFAWRDIANLATQFLIPGPLAAPYDPLYRLPPVLTSPMIWLLVAGVIGYVFARHRGMLEKSLSIATAIASIAFAPALALAMYLLIGESFPVPGRYAISLAPAMLIAAAFVMRTRIAVVSVTAYGALTAVAVVVVAVLYG